MKLRLGGIGVLLGLCFCASGQSARADIVTEWNSTIRNVMQENGAQPVNQANPGWSTRSIAMMNGAIYDAFQATNRTHQPFMADLSSPGSSVDAAVNQASYELLLQCYPGQAGTITAAYNSRMAAIPDSAAKTAGTALGTQIAGIYMAERAGDHASDSIPYTPGVGPGVWRPRAGQTAWGPGWGTVSTFGISSSAQFVATLPPLPALNSPEYTAAFNEVKAYGDVNSSVRTPEQTEMGLFWAYDRATMGPPPVLFVNSLEKIADAVGTSPEDNARLFAMASVAQADASIAAWDAKFQYNFWRPVAAIQEADTDGNPNTIQDAGWNPLGAPGNDPNSATDDFTPPFPAWISGHATMGGAVFKAVELFFGTNDFATADALYGSDPVTSTYTLTSAEAGGGDAREFHSFSHDGVFVLGSEDSPDGENAASRIYLGVHWIMDQRDGMQLGHDIATYINANDFQAVPEPGTLAMAGSALAMAGFAAYRKRRCAV